MSRTETGSGNADILPLSAAGLDTVYRFKDRAAIAVTARFYTAFPDLLDAFGEAGRKTCRQDIEYHLEFLRPALEFGEPAPFIEFLRWLHELLEARGAPADHLPLALDWLQDFYADKLEAEDARRFAVMMAASKSALAETDSLSLHRSIPGTCASDGDFVEALVRGDRRSALASFQREFRASGDFVDTGLRLVQPAMYEIGNRWHANRISVAQEHLATAIAHSILLSEFKPELCKPRAGNKITLACVEDNQHAMGLRMVADAFELAGWNVLFLGANTPTSSLLQMLADEQPLAVGLSLSQPHHITVARDAISTIRARFEKDAPLILVGGYMVVRFPPLGGVLGADLVAVDAKAALEVAEKHAHAG